jgi:hypothetical protein
MPGHTHRCPADDMVPGADDQLHHDVLPAGRGDQRIDVDDPHEPARRGRNHLSSTGRGGGGARVTRSIVVIGGVERLDRGLCLLVHGGHHRVDTQDPHDVGDEAEQCRKRRQSTDHDREDAEVRNRAVSAKLPKDRHGHGERRHQDGQHPSGDRVAGELPQQPRAELPGCELECQHSQGEGQRSDRDDRGGDDLDKGGGSVGIGWPRQLRPSLR